MDQAARCGIANPGAGPCLALTALLAIAPAALQAAPEPPGAPPGLENSAWRLDALEGRPALKGTSVTLRFEPGSVAGSDGCNRYAGPVTIKGSSLTVSPRLVSTQMACPPEVMRQADSVRAALIGARSFRISDGRLLLLSAAGTPLASLKPQSQELIGTSWSVTGFNNGRQAVVSPIPGSSLTLAFLADGRVGGSAGCNRFSARAHQDGGRLTIDPAATTRRLCASPAGVMEQERQFLAALTSVASARLEGTRLELRRSDGALALSLAGTGVGAGEGR